MSIKIMSRVWEVETESHTEKLVLLALADNASDHGVCWPSMRTLAMKCNMTEQGVRYKINDLIKRGWVYKSSNTNGYKSNQYTIRIPANATIAQRPPLPKAISPPSLIPLAPPPNAIRPNPQGTIKEPPTKEAAANKPLQGVEQVLTLEADSPSPNPACARPPSLPPEAIFWNENCGTLPKVLVMSKDRWTNLNKRRLDDRFKAQYQVAVKRVAESDFCHGKSNSGWIARFDWMLQEDVIGKIMEGTYDNRGGPVRPAPTGEKDILLAALR